MANNRRSFLQTLAVLPAALVAPVSAFASSPDPDAELIAFAAEVEALAVRTYAVLLRQCDLQDKAQRQEPTKPEKPPPVPLGFDCSREDQPDGGFVFRLTEKSLDPAAAEAAKQAADRYAVALKGWTADRDKLHRQIGVRAAERLHNRLYWRLRAATMDLTAMTPTTLAGLAAKARVVVEIDPHDESMLNDWERAIRTAVVRDAIRIGEAA